MSNLATALSVALAGPTTSPTPFVDHEVFVPSVVNTLPLLPVWLGKRLVTAPSAVDAPVPPLATGIVPVKSWSSFQLDGLTIVVSVPSGIALTNLCLTVIAITGLQLSCRLDL